MAFVDEGAEAPPFWFKQNGRWMYRGMFEPEPLPEGAPVYVTWKQASAYAAWKGLLLPTEAQFHRAAYGTAEGVEREYPWGDAEPSAEHGNFDFRRWNPVPVTAYPAGDSAWGVRQLIGNGWEWTSTTFAPFPGFAEHPRYPGYSKDFFDGEHYVLKGGSPRTAACLLRRSFRNWFRPDYPHVYATFRCVCT
jgi:formylglycine-generating enzyme required for sulfatase activity